MEDHEKSRNVTSDHVADQSALQIGVTSDAVAVADQLALQGATEAQLPRNNSKPDESALAAELPQDLIIEILLYSSVKSLLRFRCVCKSFCTVIDSNHFRNLHYDKTAEKKKHRKMIIREASVERRYARLHVFDIDSGFEENIKKPYERSPKPYGYCKGLILLLIDSLKLALWNPSTQQYRNLPRCPIKVTKGSYCSTTGMGLGYDSTHDDYKVVLIEDVRTDKSTRHLQVWVFGLRSNSWKRVRDFPHRKDSSIYFGYFADSYVHWLCKPHLEEYALVTFDVEKETIVSQPLYPAFSRSLRIDLHVLDGCLCMSSYSTKPPAVIFYAREKDGTVLQWNKLFSVTPEIPLLFEITRFKNVRVLGYSKGGDKVMLDLGFKFIVLYDLKGGCFDTSSARILLDDDTRRLCNYPFLCHESLVSVGVDEGSEDLQRQSGQKRKNRA